MSGRPHDAIVVGLGAHGSAATYHLARRGLRVLGVDRFARAHPRQLRRALADHPALVLRDPDDVPLLKRAWDLWRELERESGEALLTRTGALSLGPPDGEILTGAPASARQYGLAHELVEPAELRRRFPLFQADRDWAGLVDAQAGRLAPQRCIEAHLRLAERHGATLPSRSRSSRGSSDGASVRLASANASHAAARLVLAAGAWMSRLLPKLAPHVWVERNVRFWFEPREHRAAFAALPVWIMEEGERLWYGFPYDEAHGLKRAGLHVGDRADPDTVERAPRPVDEARVRTFLRRRGPLADGERRLTKVCMWTNSPDGHFVIDRVAGAPVVYASACSGHGFRFATAIGELLARMSLGEAETVGFLAFDRLRVPR